MHRRHCDTRRPHVARERVDEAGPGGQLHVADREAVARRAALEVRVVGQAQVRLGHADRQVAVAEGRVLGERLRRGGREVDPGRAVDLGGDGLELLADRRVERVEKAQRPAFAL